MGLLSVSPSQGKPSRAPTTRMNLLPQPSSAEAQVFPGHGPRALYYRQGAAAPLPSETVKLSWQRPASQGRIGRLRLNALRTECHAAWAAELSWPSPLWGNWENAPVPQKAQLLPLGLVDRWPQGYMLQALGKAFPSMGLSVTGSSPKSLSPPTLHQICAQKLIWSHRWP